MEYPMLAMEAAAKSKPDLYGVIAHEIGHDWFPMLVGSNERLHFWQDEGLNAFINTFSEARRYPQVGTQRQRAERQMRLMEKTMRMEIDVPIEIPADHMNPRQRGITEYDKTSVGLQLLRSLIIGHSAFDAGLRSYIRRWAYKHPTPADFFRTMDDASGHHLDWFWREWFLESDHFDQAVDSVSTHIAGDTEQVRVVCGKRSRGVLPVLARFTFSNGTHQDFTYPAEVWAIDSARYVRRYAFVGKTVTKIELDPDQRVVDVDRANNVWNRP
ncbi:MAG: M1 family aminopeptidase [Gemmatimonadaceae bacterium]